MDLHLVAVQRAAQAAARNENSTFTIEALGEAEASGLTTSLAAAAPLSLLYSRA
ncbi:hypothetical protein OV079_04085 [Nannocystis pusilla]|uniref:Uncharacterized protein n=1 Tax=Nannocystis pusilla TaxID=889268 RepID=A0A9X3EK97_9BACT|nr:hypothetical protein [Nannocystis pusilla]MCY1004764.1 hypothetical protein [Nannocystis pusilla]